MGGVVVTPVPDFHAGCSNRILGALRRCFRRYTPRTRSNWHVRVIADRLTAVHQDKIRRLMINLPPRNLKSHLASVAFPGLVSRSPAECPDPLRQLRPGPRRQVTRDCRRIVAADWYRQLFPTQLSPQRQAAPEFETTAQGCRLTTSVGGVLTGRGADIIIIDDPLKPEEALSDSHRRAAIEWFDHTFYSRLNDKQMGAIIMIMHRLHESLPSGLTRGTIWSAT
jgi:hypothetical protein